MTVPFFNDCPCSLITFTKNMDAFFYVVSYIGIQLHMFYVKNPYYGFDRRPYTLSLHFESIISLFLNIQIAVKPMKMIKLSFQI